MQYFINMAGAEEELYKKWKEITLNSTGSDQVRKRKNEKYLLKRSFMPSYN